VALSWLLRADVPHARNTTFARSGRTALGSDFANLQRIGDVPATGEYQYVFRALGADAPPLGWYLSGSGHTAAGMVSQRLKADVPPLAIASTHLGCSERTYRYWRLLLRI